MSIFISYSITIIILALLQISILPYILGNLPVPNLLLLFMLILFSLDETEEVLGMSMANENKWYLPLAAGFILDLHSPLPFGLFTFLFVIFCAFTYYISHNFIESGLNEKTIAIIIFASGTLLPLLLDFINSYNFTVSFYLLSLFLTALLLVPVNLIKNVRF